ncbi:MAG: hypothetical protein MJZ13_07895 [Bacteroidales bacterium]|nr:hypothetical protein [Bacteroidales bacterium]
MTGKTNKILSLLFIILIGNVAFAQNSTVSPYSMYGIGLLTHREHATSAGLGHASIALAPKDYINIGNPAAINNLDSTTFYFNIQLSGLRTRLKADYERASLVSGNIDGITMGCRVTKWWGLAIGYAPYSSVGYNYREKRYIYGSNSQYIIKQTGSGGMQHAFLNNAISFFNKHLSLGASVGAMWGSFNRKETALFSDALDGENIYNLKKYTCNNLYLEYGLQFHFNIGENNFRFGGVYNNKRKLLSSYDHIVSNDFSAQLFFDDETPFEEEFHVPTSYGAGFTYTRKKFLFTVDYKYNEWGKIKNSKFNEPVTFRDNWKCGGGIQFSAGKDGDPFYKRIQYRIGYYMSPSYMLVHRHEINEQAVTLGMTVPMGRFSNSFIIAYEYLKRGQENFGLIEEKSHNIKVAFNIREGWFKKHKFD